MQATGKGFFLTDTGVKRQMENTHEWVDTKVVGLDYLLDGKPHWTKNPLNGWLSSLAYNEGEGHVEVSHPDHQIDIWCRLTRGWTGGDGTLPYTFTLEFNGKFIKSGKSLDPLINKLNKLDLGVV